MNKLSHTKKVRGGRVSETQIKAMIDFMEADRSLVTGKFPGMNGRDAIRQKWNDLSIHLNALKGAEKNSTQWQVTWRDLKSRTSLKIRNIRRCRDATGNKAMTEENITLLDERIIGLIGHAYVDGSGECPDSVPEEQELIDRLVDGDNTALDEPPTEFTVFSTNDNERDDSPCVIDKATADAVSTSHNGSIAINSDEPSEILRGEKRAAAVQISKTRLKRPCNRERLSTQLQQSKQEFVDISKKHADAMMTLAEAMKVLIFLHENYRGSIVRVTITNDTLFEQFIQNLPKFVLSAKDRRRGA